jgi:hypothetical protein
LILPGSIWGLLSLISVVWVIFDVMNRNKGFNQMATIMWVVITLVFGVLGAIFYYFIGRK